MQLLPCKGLCMALAYLFQCMVLTSCSSSSSTHPGFFHLIKLLSSAKEAWFQRPLASCLSVVWQKKYQPCIVLCRFYCFSTYWLNFCLFQSFFCGDWPHFVFQGLVIGWKPFWVGGCFPRGCLWVLDDIRPLQSQRISDLWKKGVLPLCASCLGGSLFVPTPNAVGISQIQNRVWARGAFLFSSLHVSNHRGGWGWSRINAFQRGWVDATMANAWLFSWEQIAWMGPRYACSWF